MKPVGLVYSDTYLEHDMGPAHPECPDRLRALMRHLDSSGLMSQLVQITPEPCPLEWVEEIHAPDYIRAVEQVCLRGGGPLDYGDTVANKRSYEAALLAAGGGLAAVDAVMDGKVAGAFSAVRPPGHHAEKDCAMGFCIFNNVAIAARRLTKHHGLERVLIVDWDVHHGNGTEHSFYDSADVFYFSVHQYPHYPGTGAAGDSGAGDGEGFTLNTPLAAGADDETYLAVFNDVLLPRVQEFEPQFVLISAGFDAHMNDPLSGMQVTEEGFRQMTEVLGQVAEEHAQGRIVSFLEGGYSLDAMPRSVGVHLQELAE